MPGSFAAPQDAQTRVSGAPQLPQKREPAGFSAPHAEQDVTQKA
jgi:hypothetical protein